MTRKDRGLQLIRRGWARWVFCGLVGAAGCSTAYPGHSPRPISGAMPSRSAARNESRTASKCIVPFTVRSGNAPGPELQRVEHQSESAPHPKPVQKELLGPVTPPADRYPIGLTTALRLAGGNSLQIAIAEEGVQQARARLEGANSLWLPTVNVGAGYNKHDGRIQDTSGQILEVSRNSLFVGGGPLLGGTLNGGNNGPSRLTLGVPLADALFQPLAERQQVQAAEASHTSTFNDTLLQAGLGYLDLQFAQAQLAIAAEAVKNARELVRLVDSRVRAGAVIPADGLRAQTELAGRRRQLAQAEEAVCVASAELARLVRLDVAVTLLPVDAQPVPVTLVPEDVPLPDLLAQGLSSRPELAQFQALVEATLQRLRQERFRPFIPSVQLGLSAGGFGGGQGAGVGNFGGRTDFDALLVWELQGLGLGNRALQRGRASQHRQAQLTAEQTRDLVLTEIVQAYHQVQFRRQQMDAAREQVKAASEALPLNFKGIIDGVVRAIEAQQAVQSLASAQFQYAAAITGYNQAQFRLLRAIGKPLDCGQPSGCAGHNSREAGLAPARQSKSD